MSTSNGSREPTETSPLLSKDAVKPVDPALAEPNALVDSNGAPSVPGEGQDDEEAGADETEVNPLFEGNSEMKKRLPLLIPALAIGLLLVSADQTFVVSSYGKIGSDLEALENTSWIATS